MAILKLAQLGDIIVAIYSDGYFRAWSISSFLLQKSSQLKLRGCFCEILLNEDAQGMQCMQNRVIVFSRYALYAMDFNFSTLQFTKLPAYSFFKSQKQAVTSMIAISPDQIILGTNKGNLYRYQWQAKKSTRIIKQPRQTQVKSNFTLFQNQSAVQSKITALLHQKDQKAYIGYSNGIILRLDLSSGKQEDDFKLLTSTQQTWKQPVAELKLSHSANQLYSIHQSLIVLWEINKKTVIYVISIERPVDILLLGEEKAILVNQSKQLTYFNLNTCKAYHNVTHSSRITKSATVLSYKGYEYFAVGGDSGLVDVFGGKKQICLCVNTKTQGK